MLTDIVSCSGAMAIDNACFCLLADMVSYSAASHGCLADHSSCTVSYLGGDDIIADNVGCRAAMLAGKSCS